MNGGLWPTKCSSGWSPATMAAGEGSSSVPPAQPRSQNVQAQMEINSLYPLRNPVSQDPTFNSMNPVHGGPGSGEMRTPTLSLLSGNYPQPNYNNALQSFAFPFTAPRPISESQINEIQNRILQNSFSKGGPSLQVNVGNVQSGFIVQSLDFRAPQKVSLNGKSASKIGDQILVFCMNTVGELFVVESRYLGVICVCHKLKMSVAKFCEHSGINSSKAGESVYMENGMTISQWAKYFLQVESIKWDWPNESVGPTALVSNNNNNNSMFKNPGQVKNIFNGYNYNNNNNIAVLSANPNLAAQRGQIGPDLFRGVIDRPNSVEKMVSCGNNNNWNRENNTSNSLRFDKGVSYGNITGNRENNNTSSSSLRFEKGPSFENSIGNRENNTTSSSLRFEKRPSYGNNNWNRENNSSNPSSIFEKGTTNGNSSRNSENSNSSYSLPRFEIGVISGNSTGNRENNPSSSSRFEITPSYGNNTQNRENNKISSLSSAFGKVMDFGNSTGNRENNNSGMSFGNSSGNRENNKSSSPSGFELKLGQPSSNTNSNSMRGVIPSYSQPCTVFDAQNSHHQPFVNKDFPSRETAKPMQNPQKEDLPFPGNPSTVNSNPNLNSNSNSSSNPAYDEFGPDSVKNSLISLFLSHLERKNPTESTDDAFRNNNNNNDSFRGLDEKSSSFLDHQTKSGLYDRTSSISLDSNLSFSRFYANDGGPVCNFSQNLRPCSLNVESSTSRQHGFQPVKDLHLPKKPEKLATFCEKAPQHGKMCCLSNLNNNNNNNNQNALNEEISHESRCNNHMPIHHQCVCMREQFGPCCTCANEKLPCVSTHEILTKCGAHCISYTEKSQNNICSISSLEEQHTFEDSSQRPNLLNPNPNLWKDVPKKDFQERVSIPEKEISSISSGSSAQAVTQASVQTGTNEPVPVLADEASGVEKCGSSDEKNEFDTQIELSKSANSIKKSDSMRRKHVLACTVQNKPVKRLRNNFGVAKSFTEKRRNEKSVDLVHREPVSHSDSERFSSERDTESSDRSDSGETFTKKRKEKSVDSVHHGPLTNKTSFGRKKKDSSVGLVHHGPTSFTDSGNETFCEKRKEEVDSVHRGPTQQGRKMPKYKYLSLIGVRERERETETENETGNDSNLGFKRNKPIVCGNLGIISNGLSGDLMNHNVKIVSLISVMRRTDKDKIGDKKKEIACEKSRGLVKDENVLKKNKGLVGNCSKIEGKDIKMCGNIPFGGFGESSRKIRRVRKKSMSINVTEEKEKEMDRFELSENTELDQEAVNKVVVPMNLSLSSEENQVTNCLSQRNETSYSDKGQERLLVPNSSCSVCRSSNEEEFNKIIQCNQCFISVHQACYGVSSIPKTGWFCRPCKINSFNPLCVLCGYEGGAMTRASKPQKLINSLIKHTEYENRPGLHGPHEGASCQRSTAHWVHMVCGLWTPGTRCPNVGTMGSFDVSGASLAKKNIVCSICNRAGGSCIECRVSDCSVVFHPWCAHKKGLLQNEAEGDNSEMVGFYGRCIFHALLSNSDAVNNKIVEKVENECALIEELTCARTEGFKGRKREKGLSPNYGKVAKRDGIVSQEQINAWFRINGQKPFKSCISKPLSSSSDVEPDSRKEYVRYKQLKAWVKLIVYKSGIHALGLYTSCFIPRGSMVVEYVGEIVGQRVADKREREYQSIQRLHSKSACYFFRIDKNHIIDATRKGGVARFVNHSCSPNCVAKIISIKNEKKVVFFAEREINPGEEITYDYHFNREDEGEKIPCFCNSKNCRLYLN